MRPSLRLEAEQDLYHLACAIRACFSLSAACAPPAQNFLTRTPGEAVYAGSLSPQQRAARQLGKDMGEMMDAIVRREEWMAAYW
uniref:Phage major capsid protein E n=1 Tax=Candidatus Kentrum sp. FM TaxID=2126340 RepID=A0A450SJ88_9GAMM|nr:MAG: Phage major capsid protein E [Candidatus Kentron sp. FM]VFJ54637.1 MAG: Phage major capsid protein E [Candidatus Kentron sp. FM]VFK10384.1 MAG: Phage major capsid protein E [Candidatus Kentron sp. FM]